MILKFWKEEMKLKLGKEGLTYLEAKNKEYKSQGHVIAKAI